MLYVSRQNPNVTPLAPHGGKRPTLIGIDDVSVTYGEAGGELALQGFSVKVDVGEFVAVVGPSGCGKSTLLKLVSGLRPPSVGGVIVADKEVAGPLKFVGMAFQNPALLPWRKCLDNVMLPLEIVEPFRSRKRRDIELHRARAIALLRAVGLEDTADRYPWQLSGGMQQRVALCRAIVHEPRLLLLDETFSALDAFTREELWDVLQSLWLERQFTAVLVTHDLTEAVYLADTVHVLSSRPGHIIHSEAIDLPRPRDPKQRFDPAFADVVMRLRQKIAEARR
jgi:NitT/TauT family transport system ATP-binding protein